MNSPFETLPQIIGKMDGWKVAADISTSHLSDSDRRLLDIPDTESVFCSYDYGWIVNTNCPPEHLRKAGFSEDYIVMMYMLSEREVHYAFFDCEAPIWPEFKTYEEVG